jgi:hypothetical protein
MNKQTKIGIGIAVLVLIGYGYWKSKPKTTTDTSKPEIPPIQPNTPVENGGGTFHDDNTKAVVDDALVPVTKPEATCDCDDYINNSGRILFATYQDCGGAWNYNQLVLEGGKIYVWSRSLSGLDAIDFTLGNNCKDYLARMEEEASK